MLVYRSTVAATTISCALLVGCTAPDLPTDLRKDGPPNVVAVTVMTDFDVFLETATYCRPNDEKRPTTVGLPDGSLYEVCPEDLTKPAEETGVAEGIPDGWFVRIAFDRLLDPTVEDLVPILDDAGMPTGVVIGSLEKTQPVTLSCDGKPVAYKGYYVPNGNSISWPVGPALVIQPKNPRDVATGATCELTILDKVHSKSGQSVAGERSFKFAIGPMALLGTDPALNEKRTKGEITLAAETGVALIFSARPGTLPETSKIKIWQGPNLADGKPDAAVCATGGGTLIDPATIRFIKGVDHPDEEQRIPTAAFIGLTDGVKPNGVDPAVPTWKANTTYRLEFDADAVVTPLQGGNSIKLPTATAPEGEETFSLCFHTPPAE